MANRCLTPDGKEGLSCKAPGTGNDPVKGKKGGRKANTKFRKTVSAYTTANPPTQTKVEAGHRTEVTDAIKGDIFKGDTKDYKGEDKTKTYDSGNKGEGHSAKGITETYYNRRGKVVGTVNKEQTTDQKEKGEIKFTVQKRKGLIGRALGKDYKQKTAFVKGYVDEPIKRKHDNQKADFEKSGRTKTEKDITDWERLKVSGTETNYQLGNLTDKEIPTSKKTLKGDYKKLKKQKSALKSINVKA